jgi:hypothetical protein
MSASAVAIRKLKLVLGHINKMTCWSALGVGFLAMLMAFELAAFNDGQGLRASEHSIPALASSDVATTVSDFQIKEWPRNLRTDLRGTSIKVVLPESEPDRPWDDALMENFVRSPALRFRRSDRAMIRAQSCRAICGSSLPLFAGGRVRYRHRMAGDPVGLR